MAKKWMQKARKSMKKRGTVGDFTAYCKSLGYKGVTNECIRRALAGKSKKRKRQAAYAKAVRSMRRKKK